MQNAAFWPCPFADCVKSRKKKENKDKKRFGLRLWITLMKINQTKLLQIELGQLL